MWNSDGGSSTVPIERVVLPRPPAPGRSRADVPRALARGASELLLTLGVVFLLFVVYEVYVTNWISGQEQQALSSKLRQQWTHASAPTADPASDVPANPPIGSGIAFIRIPRLGADYRHAIVEGTAQAQLAQGPGHYVGTAMPGQPGNVAIAGHRVGKGSPFLDLGELRPGDPIVIETRDYWFVYRVLGDARTGNFGSDPSGIPGQQVVLPTDVSVIAPTPGVPGSETSGTYLTITTCNPKYSSSTRLVVHAALQGTAIAKTAAPDGPPALHGS
jgi:sortase (surface protein transpeptidase)